jgi:hypothetical protein
MIQFSAKFRAETLSHRIKLYGGSSACFKQVISDLNTLFDYAEQFLPSTPKRQEDPSGLNVIFASTPMVTKMDQSTLSSAERVSVPPLYQFPMRITGLLKSGKFLFTDDNLVRFKEVYSTQELNG